MKTKTKIWIVVSAAIILSMTFTTLLFTRYVNNPSLPVYSKVAPFTLTGKSGEPFSSESLKGKIWIADFIFTTCGDICPIMTRHMASLSRTFKGIEDIDFVTITVNPEQDTPERLKEYAESHHADTDQWHFLTGDRQEIRKIAVNQFKVGATEDPLFHSAFFVLVDREGNIRGYYEGTREQAVNKLFLDASNLLKKGR